MALSKAGFALGVMLLAGCGPGASGLTVRLHNVSSGNERDLTELKITATGIFARSGIVIHWAGCAQAGCGDAASPSNIELYVVNDVNHSGYHTLAWTKLNASAITVHYKRAQKMAKAATYDVSPGQVLGYAAAHEIGHLLLRSAAHSLFGIMKATYDPRDLMSMAQGRLFFSAEESQAMRRALVADHR